jgi:hypothetical protein
MNMGAADYNRRLEAVKAVAMIADLNCMVEVDELAYVGPDRKPTEKEIRSLFIVEATQRQCLEPKWRAKLLARGRMMMAGMAVRDKLPLDVRVEEKSAAAARPEKDGAPRLYLRLVVLSRRGYGQRMAG